VLLISNICVVLVSFGVAGLCIQSMVERVEKGAKEVKLSPCHCARANKEHLSALRSSTKAEIERMPCQPASHAVALAGLGLHHFQPCAMEILE
jgi:hypothetical protein